MMNLTHGLILGIYSSIAGVFLLAGYIYKLVRDHRDNKKRPTFEFPAHKQDVDADVQKHDNHLVATH
jgi:hypothetical protein